MPRRPRETSEGIYHVATRAAVGEELFRDDRDFFCFETEVERIVSPECTLIGACALNTHYHLILDTDGGVVSRALKQLNHRYALTYNARYGRRGHAFGGRYMSVRVESDEQLVTVYRYVARNPVEAGLCEEPAEWRWSSYREAIGLPGTPWESDKRAKPETGQTPLRGVRPESDP